MLITNVSQLSAIGNLINPNGGALTTDMVKDWAKFSAITEIGDITLKTIQSKKDSKFYSILEGESKLGQVQLDVPTAKAILDGTKTLSVKYKASALTTKADGTQVQYLNLVPNVATATTATTPEKEVVAQDKK